MGALVTKLTPGQQRALDAIRTNGYAIFMSHNGQYGCGDQRLLYDVVQRLRKAGYVTGAAVRPGTTHQSGYTNSHRTSSYIIFPVDI